jgi:hypothetical protein
MLRTFGLFLLVFSLLSLFVHLDGMSRWFGTGSLACFIVDLLVEQFAKHPRHSRMRGEPLR